MPRLAPRLVLGLALVALSCGTTLPARRGGDVPLQGGRGAAAGPAVAALQAGRFDEAQQAATAAIDGHGTSPEAHAVRAIARYKAAMLQTRLDAEGVLRGQLVGGINQKNLTSALEQAETALAAVDADLAAAADPTFALELCPACWEVDWNGSGEVDGSDRRLFEIEEDAEGARIPAEDPRRRPTFRLDVGDVYWARSLVSFQRATLLLLAAYRLADLNPIAGALIVGQPVKMLTITLMDRRKVARARTLILDGLTLADRARQEYLAESDDDREWVPSPKQKSHPLPLPVDESLYRTWAEVLSDLRLLVRGEEGLSLQSLVQLARVNGRESVPGYLNLGALLSKPGDIVLDVEELKHSAELVRSPGPTLRHLLGVGFTEHMRASLLITRLERMRKEVDRGQESFARKLRYLFWLN